MTASTKKPNSAAKLTHEPWERYLPFVGIGLAAVVILEIVIATIVRPYRGLVLTQVVLAELFPGREAAIPLGITGNIPLPWLWQITWTVDLAYFCFLYPLFLTLLHRRQGKGGFIMRRLEKLEVVAQKHQGFAQRYGPWGIFAFMLIPFLVNGPLVGMILGRLAGLKTRNLLAPVVSANLIGNAVWVMLFEEFFWQMRRISDDLERYVAIGVFGFLFLLAAIGLLVDEIRERRGGRLRKGTWRA